MSVINEIDAVQSTKISIVFEDDFQEKFEKRNTFTAKTRLSPESPYPNSARQEMLRFVPHTVRTVLDVGCHMGGFGKAIKQATGAEVWGVEPNPETAKVASQVLDQVFDGLFSEDLPIPEQYFDAITFNDVLEHMPDPWAAIKTAAKKLKKDGVIVVSIPNLRHIENLMHIIKDKDFQYESAGIRDKTHLRFFTKKSAPRLFEGSGLEISMIQGINEDWWRPALLRRLAFRFFFKNLEDTRFIQFAIVARRI